MFAASLPDQFVDIERRSEARVELAQANVDFSAQARQNLDPIEQFTRDFFARGLRQGGGFRDSEIECVAHAGKPSTTPKAKKGKPRVWKPQRHEITKRCLENGTAPPLMKDNGQIREPGRIALTGETP
jgi:hypothetical protein